MNRKGRVRISLLAGAFFAVIALLWLDARISGLPKERPLGGTFFFFGVVLAPVLAVLSLMVSALHFLDIKKAERVDFVLGGLGCVPLILVVVVAVWLFRT